MTDGARAGKEELDDPYLAPAAELREDLPPRSLVHPLLGFATGMVGLTMLFGEFDDSTTLSLAFTAALLAALVLMRFRRLEWWLAMLLGFALSLAFSIGLGYLGAQFGF